MTRVAEVILVLAAALGAALAPAASGKVLCMTSSGHVALEPVHQGTKCPATEKGPHGEERGERERCQDTVLGSSLTVHGNDRAAPQMSAPTALGIPIAFWLPGPTLDVPVAVPPGLADCLAPPRLASVRLCLSTVVLLI